MLKQLNSERTQLQTQIDAQEISPADVDRMNLDREQLSQSIQNTTLKLESLNASVWQKEILLQKKHDQLDKVVTNFNASVYKIGLVDRSTTKLRIEMEFNVHGQTPEKMIKPDIQGVLKGVMQKLKAKYVGSTHGFQDECLALGESLDRLNEQAAHKLDELAVLENQIKRSNQMYTEEKDVIVLLFIPNNQPRLRL